MSARWAAVLLGVVGCAEIDDGAVDGVVPSRTAFDWVSPVLEARCATLDCHGQVGRNLRLYAGVGLRLEDGTRPGSGSTTHGERDASYRSIVGLEPEVLSGVMRGDESAGDLSLLRKPRGEEEHAPGAVWKRGGAADRCVAAWVEGRVDRESCVDAEASFAPPEEP